MNDKFDDIINTLRLPHIKFLVSVFVVFILIFGLTYFDSFAVYKSVLLIGFIGICWVAARKYISYVLYFLILWFAFENLILKYIVPDLVVYVKYLPEVILYTVVVFMLIQKFILGRLRFIKTPINFAFLSFIIVALISMLWNGISFSVGILGIRQIIRFVFVFYLILYSGISKRTIYTILKLLLFITGVQIVLALGQVVSRGALDAYLLPEQGFFVGDTIVLEGVEQYWAAGQRVFGTFRRYNELGAFLTLMVSLVVAYLYQYKKKVPKDNIQRIVQSVLKWFSVLLLVLTVVLTYARSTWIAVLLAVLCIAVLIKRDRRFMAGFAVVVIIGLLYVGSFVIGNRLNINIISDQQSANLAERILEPFSKTALRGSYDGFGRVYFWVNTPKIVALSPVFGVGPGMYGGGVAAALNNREVYDNTGIAFGIYGDTGQIDNNWLSIWGEFGTLGLLFFLLIFIRLYQGAKALYINSTDNLVQTLSLALRGMIVAAVVLGLFSPYFEIRTFAFYFWLLAGCTYVLGMQTSSNRLVF